jgi:prophage maintenance system killer protein
VLHDGISILSRVIEEKISNPESYDWLNHFREGLRLLDDYDHKALDEQGRHFTKTEFPSQKEYERLIDKMRSDVDSELFGILKDGGFDSAVHQIMQGHREEDFYPSLEEKAALLMYLIVKNHAFVDGNKRIAAACFLLFLSRNRLLYTTGGTTVISNEALASLTLFVAESKPNEMETVKRLLVSVLNRNLT